MEEAPASKSAYEALFRAALLIPWSHYLFGLMIILVVIIYNFLEMHFCQDLFTGFRGQPVTLTYSPCSKLYQDVVSKCKILHGRYLSTPWLCSPHIQMLFHHYSGNVPVVNYRRQIFITPDGGTLALDWVINADDAKTPTATVDDALQNDDKNPIIIIIPGLSGDSDSTYVKHLAFKMAKRGWNVLVLNHRGCGGVPLTSDWFYHGTWTGDMRTVIKLLHSQYPEAPLFLVGTSIGANMLIFYLGEDGINVPIAGAAAICCPWDPVICDRFFKRGFKQRFYSKALATGLKGYCNLHKDVMSRLTNWEGIQKSRNFREFNDSSFRVFANYETVDAYNRDSCSSSLVGKVMVPLLCITSLDDPICTNEAIPWDECRINDNVVLATTRHGGHLPFFEGLTANSLWWVRAVDEFFTVLQSIPKKGAEMQVSSVMKDGCLVTQLADGIQHHECFNKHKEDNNNNNNNNNNNIISCAQGVIEIETKCQTRPRKYPLFPNAIYPEMQ
ncbi:hypothetical protein ACJIZ3_015786 [Penstemon smallii]|uniref:Serine aminopeptidase S33 domain-containing protein n=1 Tax=Penstemon smallii TaxID=265156 RepID=A0ABD3RNM6_9LAMI